MANPPVLRTISIYQRIIDGDLADDFEVIVGVRPGAVLKQTGGQIDVPGLGLVDLVWAFKNLSELTPEEQQLIDETEGLVWFRIRVRRGAS